MNSIYRVVWNGVLGVWQAVSELASSPAKRAAAGGSRRARRIAAVVGLLALASRSGRR